MAMRERILCRETLVHTLFFRQCGYSLDLNRFL